MTSPTSSSPETRPSSPVRILKRSEPPPPPVENPTEISLGPNQTFIVRHVPKDDRGTSRYLFARVPGVYRDIFVHRTEYRGDFFNLAPGSVLYGTIDADERQDGTEGTRYVAKNVFLAIPHMMETITRLISENYSYHCRLLQLEGWQASLATPEEPCGDGEGAVPPVNDQE